MDLGTGIVSKGAHREGGKSYENMTLDLKATSHEAIDTIEGEAGTSLSFFQNTD